MQCPISLPARWVSAAVLEQALSANVGPHDPRATNVRITFPKGCKILVDAAVRLLSLANQLAHSTRSVTLEFVEGEDGTMGYLNRMGFFDHLHSQVQVVPGRPMFSGATRFKGGNAGLVEIARINPQSVEGDLPMRLATTLAQAQHGNSQAQILEGAMFTIFSELISNIFDHSKTGLDGFAALQVYSKGQKAIVTVSDSGLGIMETLRPTLAAEFPGLAKLNDTDLLVEIFRQGVSRHGGGRGCGLKGSAEKAIKFNAELDVRLPNTRVVLKPGKQGYSRNTAYCSSGLPLLWGTHISFSFGFDGGK